MFGIISIVIILALFAIWIFTDMGNPKPSKEELLNLEGLKEFYKDIRIRAMNATTAEETDDIFADMIKSADKFKYNKEYHDIFTHYREYLRGKRHAFTNYKNTEK